MINRSKFLDFVALQLETGDYDAHIPFLTNLVKDGGYSPETAMWLGLLYMAYYQEGSMWVAFNRPGVRSRKTRPPLTLPITQQRRNLYGGKIELHLNDLHAKPSLTEWLGDCADWTSLLRSVRSVWGNGRWASYTTSELLTHLGGPAVEPSCYDVLDSSGPKKGLKALGLEPSEASAEAVRGVLAANGMPVPMSVLESLLCDWAGMNKGTFYAGRNIDRQQGRILDVERKLGCRLTKLWQVRLKTFPHNTLGELHGWEGIDKQRLKAYTRDGAVLAPQDDRSD